MIKTKLKLIYTINKKTIEGWTMLVVRKCNLNFEIFSSFKEKLYVTEMKFKNDLVVLKRKLISMQN